MRSTTASSCLRSPLERSLQEGLKSSTSLSLLPRPGLLGTFLKQGQEVSEWSVPIPRCGNYSFTIVVHNEVDEHSLWYLYLCLHWQHLHQFSSEIVDPGAKPVSARILRPRHPANKACPRHEGYFACEGGFPDLPLVRRVGAVIAAESDREYRSLLTSHCYQGRLCSFESFLGKDSLCLLVMVPKTPACSTSCRQQQDVLIALQVFAHTLHCTAILPDCFKHYFEICLKSSSCKFERKSILLHGLHYHVDVGLHPLAGIFQCIPILLHSLQDDVFVGLKLFARIF
mmetsp:Transcript_44444/g.95439  ORF Transcript_44444/g.95439 Transcript_44444/m.95439 type:complete len:285 (-) Transcript_44444:726-1580(-)